MIPAKYVLVIMTKYGFNFEGLSGPTKNEALAAYRIAVAKIGMDPATKVYLYERVQPE